MKFSWEVDNDGLASFRGTIGDRDDWCRVALYRIADLRSHYDDMNTDEDIVDAAIDATGWYSYGNCPGRPFGCEPYGNIQGASRKWVRVAQNGGLDI
jgi:hypothetical protein